MFHVQAPLAIKNTLVAPRSRYVASKTSIQSTVGSFSNLALSRNETKNKQSWCTLVHPVFFPRNDNPWHGPCGSGTRHSLVEQRVAAASFPKSGALQSARSSWWMVGRKFARTVGDERWEGKTPTTGFFIKKRVGGVVHHKVLGVVKELKLQKTEGF